VSRKLKLLCVFAHPDDESLGAGGAIAKYSREGVETYLVMATRGERGRFGDSGDSPGPETVGRAREAEARAAAKELGIKEVSFLNYRDAELDQADPAEAIGRIVSHIRRLRPDVVVTFGPDGGYGHPDHIAISQFTTAAVACSADSTYGLQEVPPHRVSKLYYLAWREATWAAYQEALRNISAKVDGEQRNAVAWPDWMVTTTIDASPYWKHVWRAVCCHKTQMSIYKGLAELSDERHRALWGVQEFYRVFSLVNGGRRPETDLFEGLREAQETSGTSAA
jgi:LmbE family N-acetylglucosaminyl deacetylase